MGVGIEEERSAMLSLNRLQVGSSHQANPPKCQIQLSLFVLPALQEWEEKWEAGCSQAWQSSQACMYCKELGVE